MLARCSVDGVAIGIDDIGMWNGLSPRSDGGRTPNIDQVAKEGMLFTDYYALALRNNYIPSHAHQLAF